jgi:hypothetical protein
MAAGVDEIIGKRKINKKKVERRSNKQQKGLEPSV